MLGMQRKVYFCVSNMSRLRPSRRAGPASAGEASNAGFCGVLMHTNAGLYEMDSSAV